MNLKKIVAKQLQKSSQDIAKNSVGKSIPFAVHEVKVPKELKAWVAEQEAK